MFLPLVELVLQDVEHVFEHLRGSCRSKTSELIISRPQTADSRCQCADPRPNAAWSHGEHVSLSLPRLLVQRFRLLIIPEGIGCVERIKLQIHLPRGVPLTPLTH